MNILTSIVEKKKERLIAAKSGVSLPELKGRIKDTGKSRDFRAALRRIDGQIRLIAEIKKASPSKGLIRKDFDPVSIAKVYESKAVNAISVLTEEDSFQGHLSFIGKVKAVSSKPVLRKDFIFDEYQIYEAKANGADAILLIAAILDRSQASDYLQLASELGLAALFEIHDEEDLEKALRIEADIVGINNRNLKTLSIDLATSLRLKREIPAGKIVVSESGIRTRQDVLTLQNNGIDAMLIGTSFMESRDIGEKIDSLLLG